MRNRFYAAVVVGLATVAGACAGTVVGEDERTRSVGAGLVPEPPPPITTGTTPPPYPPYPNPAPCSACHAARGVEPAPDARHFDPSHGLDGGPADAASGFGGESGPEATDKNCRQSVCYDPWPAVDGAPSASGEGGDVIVGPDDLQEPACFPVSSGIPFNSISVGRFRKLGGDQKVCTIVLMTKDNWALTSSKCQPATNANGTATFGYQKTTCGGTTISASAKSYHVDLLVGDGPLMWVHLVGDPVATWNSAKLGINAIGPLANGDDELFTLGQTAPDGGTKADPDCHAGPWVKTVDGPVTPTDCDVANAEGLGAPVYFDFNGCAVVPGGCAPGTGPTTAGATPGRLAGLYVGDDNGQSAFVSLSHAVRQGSVGEAIVLSFPGNYVP